MSTKLEATDSDSIIAAIKELDATMMACLNARNQFMKLLFAVKQDTGQPKRDYKQEQEFINAAAQSELYPGTAYAIWPAIMEFARESI